MIATDEIRDCQVRCQRHLLTLAMRARGEDQAVPAVAEVSRVTGAVIAEAEAASCAILVTGTCSHPGAWTLLAARLNRLAAAAGEAVAAARDSDATALCRHLLRFETMASAIWTVQDAVCGPVSTASRSAPDHVTAEILRASPPDAGEERVPQVIVP